MGKSKSIKEAVVFICLTIGLSYLVFWGPLAIFKIPTISFVSNIRGPWWAILLFIMGGFVPSGVAVVLTWVWEGRSGLSRLGHRIIQFKIGWRWYLAAILAVVIPTIGQLIVIIRGLGQEFEYRSFLTQLSSAIPLIVLGPLSEELGWRGYLLDRIQTRWVALSSACLVGIVWAFWHLPLFFIIGTAQHESSIPFLGFMIGLIALSVLFTWLHNNTNGSIWTAIFFHWIYTYSAQVVSSSVNRSQTYNWLEFLPFIIAAILVIVVWGPKSLRRDNSGIEMEKPKSKATHLPVIE